MLTSRDAAEDVVRGLDAGADDYLSKPFRFDELLARIRALHRRGGAKRLETLRYGPLSLDRLRHEASVEDRRLDLTPREFQLLEYFLLHPEEVVRRTTLLEKVWDMHFDPESNVVDVHVGNLRRKIAEFAGVQLVQTVRGVGFVLRRSRRVQQPVMKGSSDRVQRLFRGRDYPCPMRVLVVEDDLKIGAFLEQGLREEDILVDRAYDSPEALMRAGSGHYDLILLDFMLPTRSGIEVALELRATGLRTPILMLTARDAPEDRKVGFAAGVTDFLGKPFRFNDLLDRIHSLVPGGVGG